MRLRLLLFAFVASPALAESPYAPSEVDAVWRSTVAALIAFFVYVLTVLQQPKIKRPTLDVVLARALLTGIFAVVAVLLVRQVSKDNLAAEWLTAAIVGSEGPTALRFLRDRFKAVWGSSSGGGSGKEEQNG